MLVPANSQEQGMHCIICKKVSQQKCGQCKMVFYCDNKCLQNDYQRHSLICSKTPRKFYNKIIAQHQKIWCTTCINGVNLSRKFHQQPSLAQPIIEIISFLDKFRCIICNKQIHNDDLKDKRVKVNMTDKLSYYRCILCVTQQKYLCTTHFIENNKCLFRWHQKWSLCKAIYKEILGIDNLQNILFWLSKLYYKCLAIPI